MKLSMIVEITSLTPRVTFKMPGDRGPRRADEHARSRTMNGTCSDGRQVGLGAEVGGEQRAEPVLAVGADVEQAHLEPDGDGDAGDVVPAPPC